MRKPIIPFGHEDRSGFHYDEPPKPSGDYSVVRHRWFIVGLSALALAVGLLVHWLSE